MDISPEMLQILIALAAGIALSASCGFRVFIPPLIVSVASAAGIIDLDSNLAWMGSGKATLVLAIAAVLEIAAYYIPALDNLLDTLSAPASAIAGTILTAALLGGDVSPGTRWVLAAVAGGGTAFTISAGTAAARGASTAATAGCANHLLATGELFAATILSVASLALPLLGLAIAIALVIVAVRLIGKARATISRART